MDLQDLLAENGRRGGTMLYPKNSFFLLGVLASVPMLVKIDKETRP